MWTKVAGLALISIVFLVGEVRAQDPEITETILPEIKRVGLQGKLKCVVINQMDNPVYWIHRDSQMHISKDDKIEIDEAHNRMDNGLPKYDVVKTKDGEKITYTLVINRLERRDSGHYTCQILVRGTTRHPSKDGEMVVLVPPSIIQTSTTHTITAKPGESLNLTCEAEGYPTPNVTWVRVDGGLLPNGKLRHAGRLYEIRNIETSDRGIFRCLADNAVRPPAVYDTTVLVDFMPTAMAVQSSYGQAENRMLDLTIECRVAGLPEPDLQWYQEQKGGGRVAINNNDEFSVNILLNHANILSPQERWFQLVIRSVTANDYGTYICEGRNKYGNGEARVRVFATSECQGPNCPLEQTRSHANALTTSLPLAYFIIVLRLVRQYLSF